MASRYLNSLSQIMYVFTLFIASKNSKPGKVLLACLPMKFYTEIIFAIKMILIIPDVYELCKVWVLR